MTTTLLIRLSDERSWACEPFSATNAESLRDGCLEAFVSQRVEWTARGAAEIPAYQTINRASHEAVRSRSLFLQVCYHGEWCAQPWTPKIREPGSIAGAMTPWIGEDWADAWGRCIRTWKHVHAIGALINRIAR